MKFLELISSSDRAGGGPIEGAIQIDQALRRLGHSVTMVTADDPAAAFLSDNASSELVATGPARGTYGYTPKLLPWLRKHASDYDAILVNGLWQFHAAACWKATRATGTPYYVFPHGMLDPWFRHTYPLKHIKKTLYWRLVQHRALSCAAGVLFTCDQERLLARESFKPYRVKEYVLGYGTALPPDIAATDATLFHEAFPQVRGKRIILFLGRIHPKKGCDLLIKAFSKLAAHSTDFHLVFAGPDEQRWRSDLESMASSLGLESRITWTGMLSGQLKWSAFRASEVFCLPSHQENFGVAVAEALALGVPVLISDKVNIWREIHEAGAGLVEPDDINGTTRLLERWAMLGEAERQAMGQRAKLCFSRHFNVDHVAKQLIEITGTHAIPKSRAEEVGGHQSKS